MKTRKLLFAVSLAAAALASAGAAFGHNAHASAARAVVSTHHTSLGTILVTGSGQTLYLNTGDKPPHFACAGSCLTAWPPYKTGGAPKAAGAAKAANLSTVKGPGGIKMVTYKGHPLYTFASDSKSQPTSGEGVNGFFVVSPSGSKLTASTKTTTTTSSSSSSAGGYRY